MAKRVGCVGSVCDSSLTPVASPIFGGLSSEQGLFSSD